ncbi:MAG TPA: hypothetical protein VG843_11245 [Rhizomicrobium sp.]|jgi:hypothetical protein|nr:hypothetical protein [Rhizomicrobium sp.]
MAEGAGETHRYARLAVIMTIMLSLVGCGGLGLLSQRSDLWETRAFRNYDEVALAYANVVPGRTSETDLARLGFNPATQPNARKISYLGLLQRIMPKDSTQFDRLDAPVRGCIEARERCSAWVFHPQHLERRPTGSVVLDLLGFNRTTVDRGWTAEVVLLMEDGHVIYKTMAGKPHVEGYHDDIGPPSALRGLGA